MTELEQRIREYAHRLWEQAGQPHGRSHQFWLAAEREIGGDAAPGGDESPIEEPPEVAAQHGVATGQPGERIAEQGVLDDRLDELVTPHPSVVPDRNP
jgi:hypothetical protein